MIFYSTTEAELFDWDITERSMTDIKATGFDSVYLEYRNTKASRSNPRFQKWLTRYCQLCRNLEIEVAMDMHIKSISTHLHEYHPEVFTDPLQVQYVEVLEGNFTLKTEGEPLHWGIEKAYLITHASEIKLREAKDVTLDLTQTSIQIEGGGCAMTEVKGPSVSTRAFSLLGHSSGELMLITRVRYTYADRDMGHPDLLDALPRILETMASQERPVRGFMWDEPHFGFAFFPKNGRAISDRLYERFEERFGYDLRSRLIELWWNLSGKDSSLVRLHYAELLEGELAALEARFVKETELFNQNSAGGHSGFLGMHRTMHEELSDDFFIGCSDYFRHNQFTSSGFTDSVFERDDSMLTFFRVAQSLALDSRDGEAWSNNWGFRPTEAHHRYYLPLMGLMRIRWIAHTYHDSMQFGPGYPDHPLWKDMKGHLREHTELFDALEGTQPTADTAVVYNWKVLARYHDASIHTHRRDLLLLSKQLMQQGTQFLFITDEMLVDATIENGVFVTRIGSFKRLILPWADLLEPGAFDTLELLAAAKIEVILFGSPAELTADGTDVRDRFGALIDGVVGDPIKASLGSEITLKDQAFTFAPKEIQPNFESNPKSTYADYLNLYPITPIKGTASIAHVEDRCIGVSKGSIHYFGFDLPYCPGAVKLVIQGWRSPLPKGAILIQSENSEAEYLGVCGEFGEPVSGNLEWEGHPILLEDVHYALFQLQDCEITTLLIKQ